MLMLSEKTEAQSAKFVDFDANIADARATVVLNEHQESILRTEAAGFEQKYPKADCSVKTRCPIAFRA